MKPFQEMTSRELSAWYSINPSRRPVVGWGRHKGKPTDGLPDKTYKNMTDWLIDNLVLEHRIHPELYPGVSKGEFPQFALERYRQMYQGAVRQYDEFFVPDVALRTAISKLAQELKTKYNID